MTQMLFTRQEDFLAEKKPKPRLCVAIRREVRQLLSALVVQVVREERTGKGDKGNE